MQPPPNRRTKRPPPGDPTGAVGRSTASSAAARTAPRTRARRCPPQPRKHQTAQPRRRRPGGRSGEQRGASRRRAGRIVVGTEGERTVRAGGTPATGRCASSAPASPACAPPAPGYVLVEQEPEARGGLARAWRRLEAHPHRAPHQQRPRGARAPDQGEGLAVFASDNISSSAYATEEIMRVLVLAGAGALALTLPISLGIVALLVDGDHLLPADALRLPQRGRELYRLQGEPGHHAGPGGRHRLADRLRAGGRRGRLAPASRPSPRRSRSYTPTGCRSACSTLP